jgi:ADP-heptose:LPS heptosyltransferase
MHGTGVYSNTFTLMLGARATGGFVRPGDGPGRLDAAFEMPSCGRESERLLAFAAFLGATPQGYSPEFPLLDADHDRAGRLLARARRPLVGVHVLSREPGKRWPARRFAAARVVVRQSGGTMVFVGERERDGPEARAVSLGGIPALDLTGRTTLGTLGAVIARLSVLLTNDSGRPTSHMPSARRR